MDTGVEVCKGLGLVAHIRFRSGLVQMLAVICNYLSTAEITKLKISWSLLEVKLL
jgi:hypothetical protein